MKRVRLAFAALAAAAFTASAAYAAVSLPVPYMRQPDNQTCLPTCLTMTLHYMGREELTSETVQRLHKDCWYDRYNLPRILARYGLYGVPTWYERGWTKETVKRQLDRGRPVILGCNTGAAGHFILAVGYTDDDRLIINDPTKKSPAYDLGGDHNIVNWDVVLWRGGIIVDSDQSIIFTTPTLAAQIVKDQVPERMKPGEVADCFMEVINTGTQPWPAGLTLAPMATRAPIQPATTPKDRESSFAVEGKWLAPNRVGKLTSKEIAPGETARIEFRMKAPDVERATAFREHFGLIAPDGKWIGGTWIAGKGELWRVPFIAVEPKGNWSLPLEEKATGGKPSLPWQVKFGAIARDDRTPAPPDGSPVLSLIPRGQRYDTAWLGDPDWTDYRVEAWVYCDYRTSDSEHGWERSGLFMRSNGHHAAGSKTLDEQDECIAVTYDSDDGYLRAGYAKMGGMNDYRPAPRFHITESGWHKFAIQCTTETVRIELDGKEFVTAQEKDIKHGDCGVFSWAGFDKPEMARGIRFAGFRATK